MVPQGHELNFSSTKVDFLSEYSGLMTVFACLTRLASNGRCGLAETVGLCFCVDSDSASFVSVLDLVCVLLVFVLFPSVLGNQQTAL